MRSNYLVLRLLPGDDLYVQLESNCQKVAMTSAAIISAVGCIRELKIRTADGQSIYHEKNYFEVTSLSGTISEDGAHIHIQVCDANLRSIGGHLLPGTFIHTTMELVIVNLKNEYRLTRSYDEVTGYDELEIKRK